MGCVFLLQLEPSSTTKHWVKQKRRGGGTGLEHDFSRLRLSKLHTTLSRKRPSKRRSKNEQDVSLTLIPATNLTVDTTRFHAGPHVPLSEFFENFFFRHYGAGVDSTTVTLVSAYCSITSFSRVASLPFSHTFLDGQQGRRPSSSYECS